MSKNTTTVPDAYIDNILSVLARATEDQRRRGTNWYQDARLFCLKLALDYDLRLDQAVGIVAALSQSTRWELTKRYAVALCRDGEYAKIGGLAAGAMKRRALLILAGQDPRAVLGWLKLRSFFENILVGGGNETVTVDRHAVAICLGRQIDQAPTPAEYCLFAQAYRLAAARAGIEVSVLQATTWLCWRESILPGIPRRDGKRRARLSRHETRVA